MAEFIDDCVRSAVLKLNNSRKSKRELVLKREQEIAVKDLLLGKHVLAVLPTGYGKSLIFTLFLLAQENMAKINKTERSSVLVISPLRSIIEDQIAEMLSMDFSSVELSDKNVSKVIKSPPQYIYASAESAINKAFLDSLKNSNSAIHRSIALIVVDESHTVETWTGKRSKRGSSIQSEAFRDAYGKLAILRSMCKERTPVLALTGTADEVTQKVICSNLAITDATKLFVSPNRTNLRFDINKVPKTLMLSKLDWIANMIKQYNIVMPKTIIFCDTIYALAQVVNYLLMKLGTYAFYPNSSKKREDCLIGIFHSMIKEKYKQRIFESLKGSGTKRVVVATSALSMGVNFPDIKYVVMYGPPRNLLDFHQQAGRAGRDGALAHTVLFYYGQQVAHVENEMREFLQSSDCFRVASYSKFDKTIAPLSPHHICCNTCSKNCECGSLECKAVQIPHEQQTVTGDAMLHVSPLRRSVNEEDRSLLKDALEAHQTQFSIGGNITAFGLLSCYGFSKEAISDVLDNCHKLFTIKDILYCVPVFSTVHAKEVLSVINEVFDDIDESTFQSTDDDGGTTDFKQFSLDDLQQSEFNETALAEDLNEYDFI